MSFDPGYLTGNRVLIGTYDVTEIFRVHSGGQLGRSDKINKHDCELPTLCVRLLSSGGGYLRTRLRVALY